METCWTKEIGKHGKLDLRNLFFEHKHESNVEYCKHEKMESQNWVNEHGEFEASTGFSSYTWWGKQHKTNLRQKLYDWSTKLFQSTIKMFEIFIYERFRTERKMFEYITFPNLTDIEEAEQEIYKHGFLSLWPKY